jgi:hypothetical protein
VGGLKGLGNYSSAILTERKPGVLLLYTGDRASIRFHDGPAYAMPAAPLRAAGIAIGDRFMLIVRRRGIDILDVHVEPLAVARPARHRQVTPKVYVREGQVRRKLVTRRGGPKRSP